MNPSTASHPTNSSNRLEDAIPASDQAVASTSWNSVALFFGDLIACASAMAIGGFAAYAIETCLFGVPYLAFKGPYLARQLLLLAGVMVAICGKFAHAGHYTMRRTFHEDLGEILNALLVGFVISGFVEFAYTTGFSRLWLLLTWLLATFAIPLMRIVVRWGLTKSGTWVVKAAMIGLGRHGAAVKELLGDDAYLGYHVIVAGPLSAYLKDSNGSVGMRLDKLMTDTGAQQVFLVPSAFEMHDLDALINALNVRMIPYAVVPPIHKLPLARLVTQAFLSRDVVLLRVQTGLVSPFSQAIKRLFDVVVALLLVGLLSPLCTIVSLMIALDGGSIFFAHEYVGRGGRVFKCLKFRTMVPNAAKAPEQVLSCQGAREEWSRARSLKSDPRTTTIGTLLRVSSIEELPQLINVLRGDMSLVGPRPVVHQELPEHDKADNSYYLLVRPGLTGLWQVSGGNHANCEQRMHLDSWYVRNWTLWGDIVILFRTIPAVI
jgi:undecaprenyl-phosphate galactose phosphotransferase